MEKLKTKRKDPVDKKRRRKMREYDDEYDEYDDMLTMEELKKYGKKNVFREDLYTEAYNILNDSKRTGSYEENNFHNGIMFQRSISQSRKFSIVKINPNRNVYNYLRKKIGSTQGDTDKFKKNIQSYFWEI